MSSGCSAYVEENGRTPSILDQLGYKGIYFNHNNPVALLEICVSQLSQV
jgi:hypothetical protein